MAMTPAAKVAMVWRSSATAVAGTFACGAREMRYKHPRPCRT